MNKRCLPFAKKNWLLVLCAMLVAQVTFPSCSWEHPIDRSGDEPLGKQRTLLFYIAGNNSLANEVPAKLEAILKGWKPQLGGLVIVAEWGSGAVLLAPTRHAPYKLDTLKRYADGNLASAELLAQAVADMQRVAPAESYGLMLFSHASGWLPQGGLLASNAIPQACSTPLSNSCHKSSLLRSIVTGGTHEMELADFAHALPENLFHFVVCDMCFMANTETLYALRKKARYVVASAAEVLSPGFIPIYPNHLCLLYDKEPKLIQFAEAFYKHFSKLASPYNSATISVVDLQPLSELAQMVRSLPLNLPADSIKRIQPYDRSGPPYKFFDLGDYLKKATVDKSRITDIDDMLARCVLYKANTSMLISLPIKRHSGLSVYIEQVAFPKLNAAYRNTDWYRATH